MGGALGAQNLQGESGFGDLSLEELMSMDLVVSSASRRDERLAESAAAIFVISREAIQRSGAEHIPELLRMVPGLQVARVDASKWAVSARGFNGQFSNKLLVLMDGRSLYNPLYSGVRWDLQSISLNDIERIEVVRGPGGALWGANAVNGVINILTRHAKESRGNQLSVGGGNQHQGHLSYTHGATLEDGSDYRVTGKLNRYEHGYDPQGAHDDWQDAQLNFRLDRALERGAGWMLQGGVTHVRSGQTVQVPDNAAVGLSRDLYEDSRRSNLYLVSHYRGVEQAGRQWNGQFNFEHTALQESAIEIHSTILDGDLQYRFPGGNNHAWTVGGGGRMLLDNLRGSDTISLTPLNDVSFLVNAYVRDAIELQPGRWKLIWGSKWEYHQASGHNLQPNVRLLYTPDRQSSYWAAISRAVRTPARMERDGAIRLAGTGAAYVSLYGDNAYTSEKLTAFELGMRYQPNPRWMWDGAVYINQFKDLRSIESDPADPTRRYVANLLKGEGAGLELALSWQPTAQLQSHLAYTLTKLWLHNEPTSQDTTQALSQEQLQPSHQLHLRLNWSPDGVWQVDPTFRYVSSMAHKGVDAYATMDLRLARALTKQVQLELVGQNLLDAHSREFVTSDLYKTRSSEVSRALFLRMNWAF
ncbi:TonB-dependent receptor, plug [Magnetococcus marinus MC-1]|uniref:TonB-dependent receptor, plug n=2 Tax=Magnetococcus TaxID=162171 RepID=A0LA79_MAGMM|nr:TonB-dependent receptor, plug [Magnetococcus marinus MC-1]